MKTISILLISLFCSLSTFAGGEGDWLLLKEANLASKVRFDLIQAEQGMIFASVYTLKNDVSSLAHLAFLRKKALEGVKVKLLIDGHGNEIPKIILQALVEDGVEVRIYNGINYFKLTKNFNRNHTKILYFQEENSIILGDRNFKDMYFPSSKNPTESVDILIQSTQMKKEISEFLEKLWSVSHEPKYSGLSGWRIKLARKKLKVIERYARTWFKTNATVRDIQWKFMLNKLEFAELVFDQIIKKDKKQHGHHSAIIRLIDRAKENLTLVTPYLTLSKDVKQAIENAIDRGVKVLLLTNSVKSSDLKMAVMAAKKDLAELINLGVNVYLFEGSQLLHAKTYMVDQKEVYIGSFNLDLISRYNNLESGVIVNDEALYRQLEKDINLIKKGSRHITEVKQLKQEKIWRCGNWLTEYILIPLLKKHF